MCGRKLTKWKKTGKYAWHENTSEYQFRVSPKFKTSKQAEAYADKKGLRGTHFTVRDKPTHDECKADKLDSYGYYTEKMGGKPSTTQLKEREGPDIWKDIKWKGKPKVENY